MKGKPTINQPDIDRVLRALAHGQWMKGREVTRLHGIPFRKIRAVAEQTGEIISGQKGYKLTRYATPEERNACIADLESRANHMRARAMLIRRYAVRHMWGDAA